MSVCKLKILAKMPIMPETTWPVKRLSDVPYNDDLDTIWEGNSALGMRRQQNVSL